MTKLPFSLYCDKEILKGEGICALLIFLNVCMCAWLYMHVCGCASGSQKRTFSLLELEFEAVVSHFTWAVDTQLWSSERAGSFLNHWTIFPGFYSLKYWVTDWLHDWLIDWLVHWLLLLFLLLNFLSSNLSTCYSRGGQIENNRRGQRKINWFKCKGKSEAMARVMLNPKQGIQIPEWQYCWIWNFWWALTLEI